MRDKRSTCDFEPPTTHLVKVLLVYDNATAGARAMEAPEQIVNRLGKGILFELRLWKIDATNLPIVPLAGVQPALAVLVFVRLG